MTANARVLWVDGCKGLAMILVILGHTLRTDVSLIYIYSFHMPLFFFLSGLVCNEKKYKCGSFIKSRFNTLVLPYIFFYLLTYLYWLFVERSFRPIDMSWWQPLLGMIYGGQWHGLMDHNGILWFLPCLFITELLFFSVKQIHKIGWQLLIVAVLAFVGISIKQILPWCANIAAVALVFFFLGNLLRSSLLDKGNVNSRIIGAVIAITSCISYLVLAKFWHNEVQMATNSYGNVLAFFVLAFLGTIGMVMLFKYLPFNKYLSWGGVFRKKYPSNICFTSAHIAGNKISRSEVFFSFSSRDKYSLCYRC